MKTCSGYSLEALWMSTHDICFPGEIRKIFIWSPSLRYGRLIWAILSVYGLKTHFHTTVLILYVEEPNQIVQLCLLSGTLLCTRPKVPLAGFQLKSKEINEKHLVCKCVFFWSYVILKAQ